MAKPGRPRLLEVRDVVARILYSDRFRLKRWDKAKEWQKRPIYQKVDEALRRSGVPSDLKVPVKLEPVGNYRY